MGRLQLQDMERGTPGAKLPRWWSTLKRAFLISIDNKPVSSTQHAIKAIITTKQNKQP
jgi:hypothetical protein